MMGSQPGSRTPSWSYASHRRRQVRRGLELNAAERLHWLETTLEEMRSLLGRAAEPREGDQPE